MGVYHCKMDILITYEILVTSISLCVQFEHDFDAKCHGVVVLTGC